MDKIIIVIENNVSYHKSREIKEWLSKNKNFKIFYLPTYSPEYNPVEKIWKRLKSYIYGTKSINGGIAEIINRFRKICWHWRENRLLNPLKINSGIWRDLL
ncbi:MAG TPA: transposase [bacterium]|nr:transposase [bacterium]HPN31982.1 transposase [bacterium]